MPDFAGAAIDLASGLFNTGIQYATSKKLMDYQNKLNIQNWRMVNEYNSPTAQMERYKAAGLNPNLVYGSLGQTAAGNLSSPSSSGINPRTNFSGSVTSYMLAAAQAKNLQLQNKNLEAQNKQIEANIRKTDAETTSLTENTNQLLEFKPLRKDALNYANTMAKLGISREEAQSAYYEANAFLQNRILLNQTTLQNDKHVINVVETIQRKAETDKTIAQTSLIAAQTVLQGILGDYYTSGKELNQAKVSLTDEQTKLVGEQIALAAQKVKTAPYERKAIELKNASQAIENYIYMNFGKKEATTKIGPLDLGTLIYGITTRSDGKRYYQPNIYSPTPNIE